MSFNIRYLKQTKEAIDRIDPESIDEIIKILLDTRNASGRLFLIGSGGGAGHASHACCDFRKLCGFEAYAPTDNVSELTARINDDGWETSLSNYLRGSKLRKKDCVFVFSVGGGNAEKAISVNLVKAIDFTKEVGASLVGIVGRDGGHTHKNADASIVIASINDNLVTPFTESLQAVLWHLLVSHPDLQRNQTKWESTS